MADGEAGFVNVTAGRAADGEVVPRQAPLAAAPGIDLPTSPLESDQNDCLNADGADAEVGRVHDRFLYCLKRGVTVEYWKLDDKAGQPDGPSAATPSRRPSGTGTTARAGPAGAAAHRPQPWRLFRVNTPVDVTASFTAAGASDSATVMVVVHDPKAGSANADGSLSAPAGSLPNTPNATGDGWFLLPPR
jgi:hypothetical protein